MVALSYKVAVISLGDVRKGDRGITIHLLDKLEEIFANKLNVGFIKGGVDGDDLYNTLQKVKADKVIILDTMRGVISPGDVDYLKIKRESANNIKEVLMITIGISSDEWGKRFSKSIYDKSSFLLERVVKSIEMMV